jgi:hypothetical protein
MVLIVYFTVGAYILTRTYFKKFHVQMTTVRYQILVALWLIMMALPIKMVLRWLLNLKYIVAIPEYFFNI